MVDEPVGAGGVVLSSTDPNFRAWTVGMQQVLWNAVLGPEAFAGVAARAGSATRRQGEGGSLRRGVDRRAGVAAAHRRPLDQR